MSIIEERFSRGAGLALAGVEMEMSKTSMFIAKMSKRIRMPSETRVWSSM